MINYPLRGAPRCLALLRCRMHNESNVFTYHMDHILSLIGGLDWQVGSEMCGSYPSRAWPKAVGIQSIIHRSNIKLSLQAETIIM